jgi:Zn-dependent protease with chaperone function
MPAAAATLFAAIVFVPSYWRFEPRDVVEGFDITLTALALGAVAVLTAAAARGVTAWSSARRRTRRWMQTSRPLALARRSADGAKAARPRVIPAFAIEADAPIMALVGVLRPRLLVTRGLIDALTEEELAASVAHEIGHSRAWDNLKRLAMRATPDLLAPTKVARAIERRWASAAEHAADRMCGDATPASRCALASALVKVARLTPPDPPLAEPISTLVGGGEIAARVHHLLDDRLPAAAPSRSSRGRWIASAVAAAIVAASYAPLLRVVHDVTEVLVHALP